MRESNAGNIGSFFVFSLFKYNRPLFSIVCTLTHILGRPENQEHRVQRCKRSSLPNERYSISEN